MIPTIPVVEYNVAVVVIELAAFAFGSVASDSVGVGSAAFASFVVVVASLI